MAGAPWRRLKRKAADEGLTVEYKAICKEVAGSLQGLGLGRSEYDNELRRVVTERMNGLFLEGMLEEGPGPVEEADSPDGVEVVRPSVVGGGCSGAVDPSDDESFAAVLQKDWRWVYLNLGSKNPGVAPSRGALFNLKKIQSDPRAYEVFLRIMERMMPPPKSLESQQRFTDDGRQVLDAIEAQMGVLV